MSLILIKMVSKLVKLLVRNDICAHNLAFLNDNLNNLEFSQFRILNRKIGIRSDNRDTIVRFAIGAEAGLLIAKSIFLAATGLVVIEAGFCIQPPLGDLREATWGTIFYGNVLAICALAGAILAPLPYAALCLQNGVPQFPCPSEDYSPQERRDYAPGTLFF